MTRLAAGGATDPGLVRRNNQDQLLVADGLFAVADGMGGHRGGEVASTVAVEALRAAFTSSDPSAQDLVEAVHRANDAVFERAASAEELRGMGTTMTSAALVTTEGEERLAIANVGDSRAYVLVQGELTQLTEDHSVPEELVRLGELAPEEVESHPQRHILTRALGVFPEVEVDLCEVLPMAGDRILLCSDGLCRELSDAQIASVLRREANPTEAASELVRQARASGGADNITVVVIDIVDDDGRSQAASEALASEPAKPSTAAVSVAVTTGEADAAGTPATTPRDTGEVQSAVRRPPRFTLRVLLFIALLGIVLGAAVGITWYEARGTYYVGLAAAAPAGPAGSAQAPPIVIYRGRPGGLLWFRPTVAEQTQLTTADVLPSRVADLRHGKLETTLAQARAYLTNLLQEANAARPPTRP